MGSTVEVTGDEAHHAVAVRRLRVGETVVLTDGLRPVGHRHGRVHGQAGVRGRGRLGRRLARAGAVGHRRPGDPQGRPRRARRRGADRGRRRAHRALGGRALGRRLEGRARRQVARPLALDRPRGLQAGAPPVVRRGRRPGHDRRRGRRWSPQADLAVVLHEAAGSRDRRPRRPPTRLDRSSSSAPRAASPTTRSRRSRLPARTPYASAPRCCAPRPPASPPSPRCCRGRRAGGE